jgi:hypothetical protein
MAACEAPAAAAVLQPKRHSPTHRHLEPKSHLYNSHLHGTAALAGWTQDRLIKK